MELLEQDLPRVSPVWAGRMANHLIENYFPSVVVFSVHTFSSVWSVPRWGIGLLFWSPSAITNYGRHIGVLNVFPSLMRSWAFHMCPAAASTLARAQQFTWIPLERIGALWHARAACSLVMVCSMLDRDACDSRYHGPLSTTQRSDVGCHRSKRCWRRALRS